jgi:hypothetical protein
MRLAVKGLTSYKIIENRNYQHLIQEIDKIVHHNLLT